jgi:Asp-tRNA(Asn)/Glu-tRNA(Gln) amidotransferase A subunit family amidase
MTDQPFDVVEATIDDAHRAFRDGSLTARALVEAYLERIEAIDRGGPHLNAVVAVNPAAAEQAAELDEHLQRTGELVGPLHGIPVLVKDQAETTDVPTTFGSAACAGYEPERDATIVARIKAAGAIVLGKTTMPDFATSWFSYSSVSGTTKNPYALDRDPGGSSSGTGAGIAASLGMVGIGEDTGGSIRLPASFCNLVGVRVTPGLISRTGLSPLVVFQDTAGPMARTVRDAALLLDSMVGYDAADEYTAAYTIAGLPESIADTLDPDALGGARIGVLRNAFGSDEDATARPVNGVIEAAIAALAGAGAEVVDPLTLDGLMDFVIETSLYITHSQHDINGFLAARPAIPYDSLADIVAAGKSHPALDLVEEILGGPAHPEEDPEYFRKLAARERFQRAIVNLMSQHRLDALVYPTIQIVPPTRAELDGGRWTTLTFPTNTLIASQAWLPSVSVPAGFTDEGLPVGMEIVGLPYAEPTVLRLAYAFEQATGHRRAPDAAVEVA